MNKTVYGPLAMYLFAGISIIVCLYFLGKYSVGWLLFTMVLAVFLYLAWRYQRPPSVKDNTFIWTSVGGVALYLVVGIYTFSKNLYQYENE